jgi:beta-glucanase (GH16 family)
MKSLPISLSLLCMGLSSATAQTLENARPLTAKAGEEWVLRGNRSDDFNGEQVDWRKWTKTPEKFGAWSWDNESNATVANGILTLTLTLRRSQAPAPVAGGKGKPGGESVVSFTSGMLKSYAKGTYGYYEARIKGAPLFPGACPSFWLYSKIDDTQIQPEAVRYSEVDIVELTQRGGGMPGNERITDHNLHTILSNGTSGVKGRAWHRPHDARYKVAQAIEYKAPFDPRDDFHTYGCLVSKDVIIWYVDSVEIGRKPNAHWHKEMNVALSLGLRAPYAVWQNNRLVPSQDQPAGSFPTSMSVDYVRVWELKAAGE